MIKYCPQCNKEYSRIVQDQRKQRQAWEREERDVEKKRLGLVVWNLGAVGDRTNISVKKGVSE